MTTTSDPSMNHGNLLARCASLDVLLRRRTPWNGFPSGSAPSRSENEMMMTVEVLENVAIAFVHGGEAMIPSHPTVTPVPIPMPVGIIHRIIWDLPEGTPTKILMGPAQGLIWIKRAKYSGYSVGDYEFEGEHSAVGALQSIMRAGDICWDIGAHHGYYSLCMAALGARYVIAFEPRGANVEAILEMTAANGLEVPIVVEEAVVTDHTGMSAFRMHPQDSSWGRLAEERPSWWQGPDQQARAGEEIERMVRATMIDTFTSQTLYLPDVLKIDVEGAEVEVLRGGLFTLQKYQPSILLSVHRGLMETVLDVLTRECGYPSEQIEVVKPDDILLVHGQGR